MRTSVASITSSTLLLLALAACGSDADTSAEESTPAESSSPSSSEGGGPTSTESGVDAANAAFLDRLRAGIGESGSVHVAMRLTGPVSMTAEGDTVYGTAGSEMRMNLEMEGMGPTGDIDMLLVDDTFYMSMAGVTASGTYFEVPEDSPMMGGLTGGGSLSPADSLKAFEAGLEEVEELGQDDLGGEQVTGYRVTVDAEKALDAMGTPETPGMPDTLDYEVWLDNQDRMRRMTIELAGTTVTADMTNWGEDVSIEAPEPGDVVDAPPMMGGSAPS
jgi:hypothetical protein